jgi:hypothetical protein
MNEGRKERSKREKDKVRKSDREKGKRKNE